MSTKEEVIFRTSCHPEAFGHEPEPNDQQWRLTFPLENGSNLIVLSWSRSFNGNASARSSR